MQSKSSEPHPSLFSSGRRRAVALSVHLVLPGVFLVEETYGRAEEEDTCDTHAERPPRWEEEGEGGKLSRGLLGINIQGSLGFTN
jgi:hypothetical protein